MIVLCCSFSHKVIPGDTMEHLASVCGTKSQIPSPCTQYKGKTDNINIYGNYSSQQRS